MFIFIPRLFQKCGPGSVVDIATGYGLEGAGIESRCGRDFPPLSRLALGPTQPPVRRLPGLSRGKEQPGRDADPSPLLVPWSRKGRAIPLLPLWAVRPVQSLSVCTGVHFSFIIFFKGLRVPGSHLQGSWMGPTADLPRIEWLLLVLTELDVR